jgi:hypothetical protein
VKPLRRLIVDMGPHRVTKVDRRIRSLARAAPSFQSPPRPAPCALRPAPCALRPAPCALRPAPCALRPAPCALRRLRCGVSRGFKQQTGQKCKWNALFHSLDTPLCGKIVM